MSCCVHGNGVVTPQEAQALRVSILDILYQASGELSQHDEAERLLRLLLEVRTDDFHTPDTTFGIKHSNSSSLKNRGRLDEALTMNTGLLSSLETEQGRYGVSERAIFYALTNRAFILQRLRTRRQQDGYAQSISASDDEILKLHSEVYQRMSAVDDIHSIDFVEGEQQSSRRTVSAGEDSTCLRNND